VEGVCLAERALGCLMLAQVVRGIPALWTSSMRPQELGALQLSAILEVFL
jgi:hypothetical protein